VLSPEPGAGRTPTLPCVSAIATVGSGNGREDPGPARNLANEPAHANGGPIVADADFAHHRRGHGGAGGGLPRDKTFEDAPGQLPTSTTGGDTSGEVVIVSPTRMPLVPAGTLTNPGGVPSRAEWRTLLSGESESMETMA